MGCGASSSNWDAREREQRSSCRSIECGEVDASLPKPKLSFAPPPVPEPSCATWSVAAFSGVVLALDLATNLYFATRLGFAITSASFTSVATACVLVVCPHVLSVYEARKDVGMDADAPFSWGQAVLNQVHLRAVVQVVLKAIRLRRPEQRPLAYPKSRALQVKMILALAVALPQALLQTGAVLRGDVGGAPPTWVDVASPCFALLAIAEAMAEFTLRDRDTGGARWLQLLFCACALGGRYLGVVRVLMWDLWVGVGLVTGDFCTNVVLVRAANAKWTGFSASLKPLTLLTDGALLAIGFVDVKLSHPTPDRLFALKALAMHVVCNAVTHGKAEPPAVPILNWCFTGGAVLLYCLVRCHAE